MVITSKKSFSKFYLPILFGFLFFNALGSYMIYLYIDLFNENNLFLLLFGFALHLMAVYTIWQFLRNSPQIRVDTNTISFGKEIYDFSEIQEIVLTGKRPFRYLFKHPMEGALLQFKDKTKKYIFDDMYSNSWKIKCFLQKTVIEKTKYVIPEANTIHPNIINFQKQMIFKGIQLLSLRGISLWGLIIVFSFILISKNNNQTFGFWLFIIVFSILWFLFNSWLMHYFSLTKNYLIVKNHNLSWKKSIYNLKDIKEIIFEAQGNGPNSARIITYDFKNKLYRAGTLKDKTWLKFKDRLIEQGIKVRNECI